MLWRNSDRVRTALTGADADRFLDRRNEDLAVTDAAGVGGLLNGLHSALDERILHDHLDLHLRQKVDHVLSPAIELGMPFLAAEAFCLGDGDSLNPDFMKSFL